MNTNRRGRGLRTAHVSDPARAFTLIELLVVVSVISVLIGILLPALSSARKAAQGVRELNALRQLGSAYTAYAQDNKTRLMPGYLRGSWARPDRRTFLVYDNPRDAGDDSRLSGSIIRPYTWRLVPYVDFAFESVMVDRGLLSEARSATDSADDGRAFHRVLARHPSFGMNTTFVGGDAHRGAFYLPSALRWGWYYVVRQDQVALPSRLMIFASSRGVLAKSGGRKAPGYHRVEGPWHATPTSNSVPAFVKWNAPARFNPALPTTTYGHLDFRNGGKASSLMFDGHTENLSLDQLSDMTRWSNKATRADWRPR